ncbi:reverse transcriptase domain-containing protein [Tanacetum coccineum]|uniref:Reverse transcriptase domain-containing protein n=1 Tax=Tanacetum coccineum TaxID=301880 RepID=A0ABQ4ZG81_9ASTR
MASEGRLSLKEKVFHWLKEGLIIKVQYPEWIANTIPIKLASRTWKVQIDYSSLNKVCAKDMYPLPEDDEEKTGFHTEEGVYCFTHMLKELKKLRCYTSEDDGKAITKFIPKLAELKHPIREARTRMEKAKESGWTNEAEEALRRIKRKLSKLQTLAIPKEGEDLMLCLRQRKETISYVLLVEREGIQIHVSYVCRPLQGMEICYTPTEKRVQALIYTARSLRTVFRKHKVKVVTDGSMEETLKLAEREGRLGKWATDIRTHDISYVQRKEAEGPVAKKFFGQGEQVEETQDANEGEIFDLTSNYAMDCETLLAGLVASANQGMKDLHVFIDSLTLVAQVLNHTSPKNLKPKSRSVNKAGNYKARIPQPRSIGRYQNKTIDRRDKKQQERQSNKQSTRGKTKLQPRS